MICNVVTGNVVKYICKHIYSYKYIWGEVSYRIKDHRDDNQLPDSWKYCPICKTKIPKLKGR